MKRFFLLFTLLALLSGCGKDDEPKPEPTPNPPSQNDPDNPDNEKINITLAPTTLSFEVQGGTLDLTVTCTTGKPIHRQTNAMRPTHSPVAIRQPNW